MDIIQSCSSRLLPALLLLMLCCWKDCYTMVLPDTIEVVVVENGTVESVVLDCPYELQTEEDRSGLVVKWYFQDYSSPVYQWIPDGQISEPQLTTFDDVIDTSYVHLADRLHRHRALRLLSPSTQHSGLWTCEVSSHYDERRRDVRLVVYSLPSSLSLSAESSDLGNLTVTCSAEPSFPEPELKLALLVGGERTPLDVSRETSESEGLYNTSVEAFLEDSNLPTAAAWDLECTLAVPYTNLSIAETLPLGQETVPESPEEVYSDLEEEDEKEGKEEDEEEENEEYGEETLVVASADASTHRSVRPASGASSVAVMGPGLPLLVLAWLLPAVLTGISYC